MIRGFAPIAGPDPRVLVLGTIPSERSLAEQRYYAHPRNCFWPIMQSLFAAGEALDYPARVEMLRRAGVAVWDVLHAADRAGSLDAAIVSQTEVPNDIAGLLRANPGITTVFFNGRKAEALFRRHVAKTLPGDHGLRFVSLPSTSPALAAMSLDEKLAEWGAVAEVLNGSVRGRGE